MKNYDPLTAAVKFNEDDWVKSPWSNEATDKDGCVSINMSRVGEGILGLRDSSLADSPVLVFNQEEWDAFGKAMQAGQFAWPA